MKKQLSQNIKEHRKFASINPGKNINQSKKGSMNKEILNSVENSQDSKSNLLTDNNYLNILSSVLNQDTLQQIQQIQNESLNSFSTDKKCKKVNDSVTELSTKRSIKKNEQTSSNQENNANWIFSDLMDVQEQLKQCQQQVVEKNPKAFSKKPLNKKLQQNQESVSQILDSEKRNKANKDGYDTNSKKSPVKNKNKQKSPLTPNRQTQQNKAEGSTSKQPQKVIKKSQIQEVCQQKTTQNQQQIEKLTKELYLRDQIITDLTDQLQIINEQTQSIPNNNSNNADLQMQQLEVAKKLAEEIIDLRTNSLQFRIHEKRKQIGETIFGQNETQSIHDSQFSSVVSFRQTCRNSFKLTPEHPTSHM